MRKHSLLLAVHIAISYTEIYIRYLNIHKVMKIISYTGSSPSRLRKLILSRVYGNLRQLIFWLYPALSTNLSSIP